MALALKILVGLLALSAVFGVATVLIARANARAADRSHPPIGPVIDVDGHPVHVLVQGEGPAIVLIHGANGNLRDFSFRLMPMLATDHTVIAIDRPGLGHTPALHNRGADLIEQARLLRRTVEVLGFGSAILVGQSFGSAVALSWALDDPDSVDGLVLVGGVSMPWHTPLDPLYRLNAHPLIGPAFARLEAAYAPQSLVDATLEAVFAPQAMPDGYADYFGVGLSLRAATIRANAMQVKKLRAQVIAMSDRYDALTMPVELIHGTADTIVPAVTHADKLVTKLADVRYTQLDGVGHMPHHSHPQTIVDAVARIAARTESAQ